MSYEKYFKDVSGYDVIDAYRVHRLFGVNDEVLCHASKKLLLSGVRTGGKTLEQDVKEARDSLTRWLEMLEEEKENKLAAMHAQIKETCKAVPWPDESRIDVDGAVYSEYTLDEVVGDAVLSDWARWVAVDKDGEVWEYGDRPRSGRSGWYSVPGTDQCINQVVPPLNFKNCIFEVKK